MKFIRYAVFAVLALGVGSARDQSKTDNPAHVKTYVVQLGEDAKAGSVTLHHGTYHLMLEESKVVLTPKGKSEHIEIPATIESSDKKFPTTRLSLKAVNGMNQLQEIDLGGTKTKIVIR